MSEITTQLQSANFDALEFAILDVETTGFSARAEMIEVAVVHSAANASQIVMNTLVRPERRVGNREVHGISNRDVRKAPALAEVAVELAEHLRGRVLVAHNVAFDLRFVGAALQSGGYEGPLPTLCTMELFRALFGERTDLEAACRRLNVIPEQPAHRAAGDAWSTTRLLAALLAEARKRGIANLSQLDEVAGSTLSAKLEHKLERDPHDAYGAYVDSLLSSGPIAPPAGVTAEIRMRTHLQLLQSEIEDVLAEPGFDEERRTRIGQTMETLRRLGWAPGD